MSVAASAAMSLSCIAGCSGFSAKAALAEYSGDELVPVIVTLRGDAVLNAPCAEGKDTGFLDSEAAAELTGELLVQQEKVQNEIRRFYPELEVGYSYSVLINGFSCRLPECLVDDAGALPQVESVTQVQSCAVAQMNATPKYCGIPTYTEAVSCSGEGQVIAVIDTELDITHPMFAALADDVDVKLTSDDIARIAGNSRLSIDVDPEKAYISSKLPYVVDYTADDPYNGYMDRTLHSYHGTHVAGIAAGNEVTDETGTPISGIAKDAQLIFMSASDGLVFNMDTAVAAMEDAVKLKADVINMSIGINGDSFTSELYSNAIDAAEKAGVTVCVAAGNDGDGYQEYSPDSPDRAFMNDMTSFGNGAMSVASADSPNVKYKPAFSHGDEMICHDLTILPDSNDHVSISELLSGTTCEYVYCGSGAAELMADVDLSGKIALIDRGELSFDEMSDNAANAGAVGVLVINSEDMLPQDISCHNIPIAMISYEDGQKLKDSDNKSISFNGAMERVLTPSAVSAFSSWGIPASLELRPDIMGFGGNIKSAYYDGQFMYSSGTSMATPYISGCAALLREYMDKSGNELSGPEKTRYIRNLLMSSSVPYIENDMYVSPRHQGSGLVSMTNVLNDKVLIRGVSGESKVSLHDGLTDEFSFDVELENISDEDVDFGSARIALTTDGITVSDSTGEPIIGGQLSLTAEADLSALTHIGAGEKLTTTVTVSLDPEQSAQLSELFVNGFFVDGFVLLEGAENCCDISMPLSGFHGDWAALPIITNAMPCIKNGSKSLMAGGSFSAFADFAGDVIKTIPPERRSGLYNESDVLFRSAFTPELVQKLIDMPDEEVFVSPDGDGLADGLGMLMSSQRYFMFNGIDVYDANGKLLIEGEKNHIIRIKDGKTLSFAQTDRSISSLPDGKYTGVINAWVNYDGEPQKITQDFMIDRKDPELSASVSEKNGRRIMTIKASDEALDGIIISGKGKGGIAGQYDPSAELNKVDLFARMNSVGQFMNPKAVFNTGDYSSAELPAAGRCLSRKMTANEAAQIDFSDVIVAAPEDNGTLTVEYDITDLENAEITALDKALNMTAVTAETAAETAIPDGTWSFRDGYFVLSNDMAYVQSRNSSEKEEFVLVSRADKPVLLDANGKFAADIAVTGSKTMNFTWYDGTVDTLRYISDSVDTNLYTADEIGEAVKKHLKNNYYITATRISTSSDSNGDLIITVWVEFAGKEMLYGSYTINERTGCGHDLSGLRVDLFAEPMKGFSEGIWLNTLPNGFQQLLAFNADGRTGELIGLDMGDRIPFTCRYNNNKIALNISGSESVYSISADEDDDESYVLSMLNSVQGNIKKICDTAPADYGFYTNIQLGNMAMTYDRAVYSEENATPQKFFQLPDGSVQITLSNSHVYIVGRQTAVGIDSNGTPVDLNAAPYVPREEELQEKQLKDMALIDYTFKHGVLPDEATVIRNVDGNVTVILSNENGGVLDSYKVDPVTGKGSDMQGGEVDLPQTGNNSMGTAAAVGAAAILTAAGVYAALRSGVIRRREEK